MFNLINSSFCVNITLSSLTISFLTFALSMFPKQKLFIFSLIFILISCCCCCCSGYAADNPEDTLARALFCFNNRFVYSGCEEKYRLNESGNLNVPLQSTDLFCNGPCLAETQFVLNCVEKVLSDFIFLNKATVRDIRSVLNSGCSYTSQRGDFNVWRYVQGETSLISGQKVLDVNGFYNLAILSGSCFLIL